MFFFFNDTATTEIYTLSLHDALPICTRPRTASRPRARSARRGSSGARSARPPPSRLAALPRTLSAAAAARDRKSTRLNSSHANISYAVFCLKKKKQLQVSSVKEDYPL